MALAELFEFRVFALPPQSSAMNPIGKLKARLTKFIERCWSCIKSKWRDINT